MKGKAIYGLLFFLLLACTKDGKNITVQGRVYNPLTGEGISDCEIRLVKESLELPGGNKTVAIVKPDANGYFELNHTSIGARYVGCFFDNEKYDELGWIQDGQNIGSSLVPVKRGKFTYLDCQAVTYGQYSLDINNINCQGPNDTIIVNQQNQVGTFLDVDWILKGCDGYTTAMDKVPMGWIYIQWTVIRNGISNSFSDEVFVGEGQEVTYTLDY